MYSHDAQNNCHDPWRGHLIYYRNTFLTIYTKNAQFSGLEEPTFSVAKHPSIWKLFCSNGRLWSDWTRKDSGCSRSNRMDSFHVRLQVPSSIGAIAAKWAAFFFGRATGCFDVFNQMLFPPISFGALVAFVSPLGFDSCLSSRFFNASFQRLVKIPGILMASVTISHLKESSRTMLVVIFGFNDAVVVP